MMEYHFIFVGKSEGVFFLMAFPSVHPFSSKTLRMHFHHFDEMDPRLKEYFLIEIAKC